MPSAKGSCQVSTGQRLSLAACIAMEADSVIVFFILYMYA